MITNPTYFAQIDDMNKVVQVILAPSIEWVNENVPGVWVECTTKTSYGGYPGIGWDYSPSLDKFIEPRPYASWSLNSDGNWTPPYPPPDGNIYDWVEESGWVLRNYVETSETS